MATAMLRLPSQSSMATVNNLEMPRPPSQSPKRGRWTNQLEFMKREVLESLWQHCCGPTFHRPLDPAHYMLPDYHQVITAPMDMGTIRHKLETRHYWSAEECMTDFRIMFRNCYKYRDYNDELREKARALEERLVSLLTQLPKEEIVLPEPPREKRRREAIEDTTPAPRSTESTGRSSCAEQCTEPTNPPVTGYEQIWELSTQLPYCEQMLEELRAEEPELVKEFWLPKQYEQRGRAAVEVPMGLLTVQTKLDEKKYFTVEEFGSDVRLIFTGCYRHCSAESVLIHDAQDLQHAFEVKFSGRPDESPQAERLQNLTKRMLCKTPAQPPATTCPLKGEGWDSRSVQQGETSSDREEDGMSSEDTDSGCDLSDSDRERLEKILVLKKRVRALQAELLAEIDQQIKETFKERRARRMHRKAEVGKVQPRNSQDMLKETRRRATRGQLNFAQKQTVYSASSPDPGRNTPRAPSSSLSAHAKRAGHRHPIHFASSKASPTFSSTPATVKQGTKPVEESESPQTSQDKIADVGESPQISQGKLAEVWGTQQLSKDESFEDEDADELTPVDISAPIKCTDISHGGQVEVTTESMEKGTVEHVVWQALNDDEE